MNKIKKFFDELDFEENVHWIIMFIALLGIGFGFYGKYKAKEFINNDPDSNIILEDSLITKKDSL